MVYLWRVPRWIALGIVLLVGAGMFGVPQVGEMLRDMQWRAAEGQVVSAQEVTRQCGRSECTRLQVDYRYTVGGSSHQGQSEISARPSEYPAGAPLAVRYDPANPAKSTIDEPPSQRALGLGIAGVVAALGVLCLLKGIL